MLRAIAIAWVMIYHASLYSLASQQNPLVGFGWMGVDLFFVLSGFLIAGQLLRPMAEMRRPDYRRFFWRRALRTLPAFVAMLAIYFLMPAWRERSDIQPLWTFLTFTQNLGLAAMPPRGFSHAWSLCVEEQFYLAFPLALALVALRPTPRIVVGALAGIVLFGMLLRAWLWLAHVASPPFDIAGDPDSGPYMRLIYYPTWSRLDGLVTGVGIAAMQVFRPAWWARLGARPNLGLAVGAAGVVAAAVLFQNEIGSFFAAVFGYPMIAASMALVVASGASPRSIVGRRAIPGVGALAAGSYSLYLSHKMVLHAVAVAAAGWPPAAQARALPAALLCAAAAGAALYWIIERPFLELRDRLAGRSRTPLAPEPVAAPTG